MFSINYTGTCHPILLRGKGNPFTCLSGQNVSNTCAVTWVLTSLNSKAWLWCRCSVMVFVFCEERRGFWMVNDNLLVLLYRRRAAAPATSTSSVSVYRWRNVAKSFGWGYAGPREQQELFFFSAFQFNLRPAGDTLSQSPSIIVVPNFQTKTYISKQLLVVYVPF